MEGRSLICDKDRDRLDYSFEKHIVDILLEKIGNMKDFLLNNEEDLRKLIINDHAKLNGMHLISIATQMQSLDWNQILHTVKQRHDNRGLIDDLVTRELQEHEMNKSSQLMLEMKNNIESKYTVRSVYSSKPVKGQKRKFLCILQHDDGSYCEHEYSRLNKDFVNGQELYRQAKKMKTKKYLNANSPSKSK